MLSARSLDNFLNQDIANESPTEFLQSRSKVRLPRQAGIAFRCKFCNRGQTGRQPCRLMCHHNLCQACIQYLIQDGRITCPLCSQITEVQNEDTNNFVGNMPLVNTKRNVKNQRICELCDVEAASYKCEECVCLMCEFCARGQHNSVEYFRDHRLSVICDRHTMRVSHICMKCLQTACLKCVIELHSGHDKSLLNYDQGIQKLCQDANFLSDSLKYCLDVVYDSKSGIVSSKNDTKKLRNNARMAKDFYLQKATEADRMLTDVEEVYETISTDIQKHNLLQKDITQTCAKLNSMRSLNVPSSDFIPTFKNLTIKAKTLMTQAKETPRHQFETPRHQLETPRHQLETPRHQFETPRHQLEPPRHQFGTPRHPFETPSHQIRTCDRVPLPLREPVHIYEPSQRLKVKLIVDCRIGERIHKKRSTYVCGLDENSVIITSREAEVMTRINTDGAIMAHWERPFEEYGGIKLLSVFGNVVYLATDRFLIAHKDKTKATYYPDVPSILHFCVASDSLIVISTNHGECLYEFNPRTYQTKLALKEEWFPSYINIINRTDMRYIITDEDSHSVKIFNNNWNLQFRIGSTITGCAPGQMNLPMGTAVTQEGILVADHRNHRISLFSFNGQFICDVVNEQDGLQYPETISYNFPFLWVTSRGVVKCFRLSEIQ